MKKLEKISIIIWALLVFCLPSCSNDDDLMNAVNISSANAIQQGAWKVTLYNDSGKDETYHFTGYTFSFNTDGTAVATKNSVVVKGTWSTGNDDSQSKLYLNFGASNPFDELNDDWHVIEQTATKIRLEDVSGGNGGTDLLTFEKG